MFKAKEYVQANISEDNTFPALNLIASRMRSSLGEQRWPDFCAQEAGIICERIEGELSKDKLKVKIVWGKTPSFTEEQFARTKNLFDQWQEVANISQMRQSVRAVSSNNTLGKDDLKFEVNNESPDRLSIAHTCFFSVHSFIRNT